jgi:hypothetical protein
MDSVSYNCHQFDSVELKKDSDSIRAFSPSGVGDFA